MAVKNTAAVYIDGINRTSRTVMPIKWGNFLDERLDECHLALRAVKKENFAPLTPVEIVLKNEIYWGTDEHRRTESVTERTKYYVIANDNAEEIQIGKGIYNHDLYLIEVTKIAECCVVDTLTFTNDLGRNYVANAVLNKPQESEWN
ncbi:MAG: hypothetical protein [Caudoviricetes sp.]|nr:MAG: hypothetical protein [Caudoviricetes sp.]